MPTRGHIPFAGFLVLAASLCIMAAGFAGVAAHAESSSRDRSGDLARADEAVETIRLAIDYGDGVEKHFTRLPHEDGMTVLDAMGVASDWSRGVDFEHKGSADTAFLVRIDDLANEGARGQKRNWLYAVNGRRGDRSFGAYTLSPGDAVRWVYKSGYGPE